MAREPRFDFLDKRPLYREDLTPAERRRSDQKRKEVVAAAPAVAATEAKTPEMRELLQGLRPRREGRDAVVRRLAGTLMNPPAEVRTESGLAVPDADWYPRVHAAPLRRTAAVTGLDPEVVATASGSMSPQNDPRSERIAARAIAEATASNAPTQISRQLKDVVSQATQGRSPVADLPDGTAKFNDLDPEHIRDLTSKQVRDSGVLDSQVSSGIAKAGTNKVAGVRGMRGASLAELAPPSSAPKVHTYSHHGFTFGVPHEEDAGTYAREVHSPVVGPEEQQDADGNYDEGRFDPFIAQEIRFRAQHAATQIPGQTTLDTHGLNDDHIEVTKSLHDYLTSRGAPVRGSDIGRNVRVRDMHPAAVLALSHPDVSEHHEDGERIQKLAKLSSNLPTVMDSHANGSVTGYAGEAAKPAGSNSAGYWGTKTLADETPIMDSRDARVTPAGLQHAEYDSLFRGAAKHITKAMDMDMDYPSTAVQAGTWTIDRALGGHDAEFNKRQREASRGTGRQRPGPALPFRK